MKMKMKMNMKKTKRKENLFNEFVFIRYYLFI